MIQDGRMYDTKSTAIVVGHNAGLGDLIVMNGAVRHLATQYDKTYLVCWDSRLKHVDFVYRDNDNIVPFVKPHPASTRQAILRQNSAYQYLVEHNPEVEFAPFRRGLFNKETESKSKGLFVFVIKVFLDSKFFRFKS